jgi:hypothetical protein
LTRHHADERGENMREITYQRSAHGVDSTRTVLVGNPEAFDLRTVIVMGKDNTFPVTETRILNADDGEQDVILTIVAALLEAEGYTKTGDRDYTKAVAS